MSNLEDNAQSNLQNSQNAFSQASESSQNHHNNPIISINTSQQFQNIQASRSQEISSSFNTFVDSQESEAFKQQEAKNELKQEKQQQDDITQQVQPESQEQSKPQALTQKKQLEQKPVDYQGMVSIKIFEKKINDSLQLKNQGNQLFKAQQYQQAVKKYSEGLRILDPQQFYGATQAECQKMAEVSASLLFNIGSCFFNLNSWRQAEIYFSETIIINPNHVKAIYKRALCRYELQNYEDAMTDIKLAFSKDKSNVQVYKSYEKILDKYNDWVKKSKEDLKQLSTKIFRKESQNSATLSPQKDKNPAAQQKESQNTGKSNEQMESSLWDYAPLVVLGGAALLWGYKKFFGK